jgi:hypothetical protein
MGRTNYWESVIIISVFLGMRLFEVVMEYRGYSCPNYCSVQHEHIKEDNELRNAVQVSRAK